MWALQQLLLHLSPFAQLACEGEGRVRASRTQLRAGVRQPCLHTHPYLGLSWAPPREGRKPSSWQQPGQHAPGHQTGCLVAAVRISRGKIKRSCSSDGAAGY